MAMPRLRDLLELSRLGLEREAGVVRDDAELRWVATTELLNPIPYLIGGEVVLTAGRPFQEDDGDATNVFIGNVARRSPVALGLGVGRIFERAPDSLINACRARGIPLFTFPITTSFAAIARAVTEMVADAEREALRRPFEAQRKLVNAVARGNGAQEVLQELTKLLSGWAVVFNVRGVRTAAAGMVPADAEQPLLREIDALRARGPRGSASLFMDGKPVAVHPLGVGNASPSYLAVSWDGAQADLARVAIPVSVSLLSMHAEQDAQRAAIRSRSLEMIARLLLHGETDAARIVHEASGGTLGWWRSLEEGLVVAVVERPLDYVNHLHRMQDRTLLATAPGETGEEELVILLSSAEVDSIAEMIVRDGIPVGLSQPMPLNRIARGRTQARAALATIGRRPAVRTFSSELFMGLYSLVGKDVASEWATAVLEPLESLRPEDRERLLAAADAYLRAGGRWAAAATELDVHVQTLRSRLNKLEEILGVSVDSPDVRANLWAALVIIRGSEPG